MRGPPNNVGLLETQRFLHNSKKGEAPVKNETKYSVILAAGGLRGKWKENNGTLQVPLTLWTNIHKIHDLSAISANIRECDIGDTFKE